jgi:predicted metal-dependent hydrolase
MGNTAETNPQEYSIIRRRGRKSVSIIVRPDRTVHIVVPHTMKESAVEQIFAAKRNWIRRKLDELATCDFHRSEHLYQEGEQFLYLGRYLTLTLIDGRGDIHIDDDFLQVTVPPGLQGKDRQLYVSKELHSFYPAQALRFFREKSVEIGNPQGFSPEYVGVKDYKSRWGSCFGDGRIFLNWKLMLAPEHIIDYVIAHELCHLKEPNHSKRFWQLVEALIPDWKARRKWLRINGHALSI